MHKPLSLRENFSWTFAGNVVNAVSLWGVIAVVTKLGSVTMVGTLELGRTVAMPVIVATMLQLSAVQVTDARNKYSFADYFGTRLVMTFLGVIAFMIIAWGWYDGETAWVILLWGVAKSIDSVSDIVRALFQKHERMNLSGISFMIKGLSAFVVVGILLWLTEKLTVAIAGLVFVWLLAFIFYDFPLAYRLLSYKSAEDGVIHRLLPRFNARIILSLLWLALPLGVVMFLSSLRSSVPKLILESCHGIVALGYFGPIFYPILMGTIVVSATGQSASPRLADYYVNDLTAYRHLMRKLLLLALGMGLLFIAAVALFGKFALRLLYTAEYAQYHTDFIILSVSAASAFVTSFCGYGLTAARAFRTQLLLAAVSCLAAIFAGFLLIPSLGVRGTVITFLIASISMFICFFAAFCWIIHRRKKHLADSSD